MDFSALLSGPIIGIIGDILKRVIPDPVELEKVKNEITMQLLANQSQLMQAQKDVMVADSSQDDKFTKRARPSVVYWSMAFITGIAISAMFGYSALIVDALAKVPQDLWTLMTVGIGAFSVSRGIEKGIAALPAKKK